MPITKQGRLQLTRALGDAYLKYPEFNAPSGLARSFGRHIPSPYSPPYVSHVPDVHHINVRPCDKFLVLATDGVWDFLSDQEVVDIVTENIKTNEKKGTLSIGQSAAEAVVKKTLDRAASECRMTVQELTNIPQGSRRRNMHDDTTVVILFLQ